MTQQEFTERYKYDASADLLGEGGFGRVYRAYDNEEHEYVALKMQSVDPKHPELRLRNEVEKVQQYRHRYIARYKECYTFTTLNGDIDVAVMKYYKDGSLDQLLNSGKLGIEERFTMLKQMLEGIAFLHSHGIIHRDLKPQNVLIVEHDGRYAPLITDFGISKQLAEGESSAVSNSILGGTYAYASPEQLKETTIRKNTDLWSFGVIAYYMLTGTRPFNCGTFSPTSQEGRQEQFRQMTSGILPEALSGVPEPWQTLIRECLVVNNTKRIAHAEDALKIIAGPVSGGSIKLYSDVKDDGGDTIVMTDTPKVEEPKQSEPVTPRLVHNELYRNYVIKALVSALAFVGLTLVSSILNNVFADPSYYDSPSEHQDIIPFIILISKSAAIIAWLSLVFTFVSIRGFARVQLSPNDTHAARTISWGVLLAIISCAMDSVVWMEPGEYGEYVPVNSYFPVVWDIFSYVVLFAGILMAIRGIHNLNNSPFQPSGTRGGLSLLRAFLCIWLITYALQLFMYLIFVVTDSDGYMGLYWVMSVIRLISLSLLILGAYKIISHKSEISEEQYGDICKANNVARSETPTLKIWLYSMGALFAIYTLNCLYWDLENTISLCRWEYGYDGINPEDYSIWSELYYSFMGDTYGLPSSWIFISIATLALSLWMLYRSRSQTQPPYYVYFGLISMVVATLILPTIAAIGLFCEYFDIELNLDGFIAKMLRWVSCIGVSNFCLYIAILIFTLFSALNRYTKIAVTVIMIPLIFWSFIIICGQTALIFNESEWLYEFYKDETWQTLGECTQLCIPMLVITFLLSGAFIVRKPGWTKWIVVGLAALFGIFTLYTTIKINSLENEAKEWAENNLEYDSEYDYYY